MAEINIQRKRMPIWPWLVGIIVVAIVVWLVVYGINRNNNQTDTRNGSGSPSGSLIKSSQQYDSHLVYSSYKESINLIA